MSWDNVAKHRRELAERILTPKQLEVVRLRIDGHSWRAIATTLGIDQATARERYQRALDRLRRATR